MAEEFSTNIELKRTADNDCMPIVPVMHSVQFHTITAVD